MDPAFTANELSIRAESTPRKRPQTNVPSHATNRSKTLELHCAKQNQPQLYSKTVFDCLYVALKRAFGIVSCEELSGKLTVLSTETVEGSSLAFQGIDDVHGSDGLSLGVLAVGDGVTDDVLEEDLEDSWKECLENDYRSRQLTSGFFVDQSRNTLDTTTTGETADSWLGDSLDVITKNLTMALGTSFSEALTSLSTSRHDSKSN